MICVVNDGRYHCRRSRGGVAGEVAFGFMRREAADELSKAIAGVHHQKLHSLEILAARPNTFGCCDIGEAMWPVTV